MSKEKLDAYTISLYHIIKELSQDGEFTASYPSMMAYTGWSQDTISRCMGELMDTGKLVRVAGGKSRVPSTYKVQ